MIEPEKTTKTDLVRSTKGNGDSLKKRHYNVSNEVLAKNSEAGKASSIARRSRIEDKMSEKLDIIISSMTPEEIAEASFRDRATAAGIFYDKLYRDVKAINNSAIQINIQTVGMDPTKVDPLLIDITPAKPDGGK